MERWRVSKINRLAINASGPPMNDSSHCVHATHAQFITGSAPCLATQQAEPLTASRRLELGVLVPVQTQTCQFCLRGEMSGVGNLHQLP